MMMMMMINPLCRRATKLGVIIHHEQGNFYGSTFNSPTYQGVQRSAVILGS